MLERDGGQSKWEGWKEGGGKVMEIWDGREKEDERKGKKICYVILRLFLFRE